MEALSRREESDLLEKGKKEAMKHCEDIVKGKLDIQGKAFRTGSRPSSFTDFADCASGRTFSVVFACNGKLNNMKSCMRD